MILRHDGPVDEGFAPLRAERTDELERAKLALLQSGTRFASVKRRPWVKRHPLVLGVGLFITGVLIGRSPILRGLVAATAVLAARTATQRLAGRLVGKVRF